MSNGEFTKETLTLRGRDIPVRIGMMPQSKLSFYLENPRLYSLVRADGDEPTQEEIQEALSGMEHVRQLVQSIRTNGGLIDPVIVLDETFVVLEGNSRLAAYRMLAQSEGVKWAKIKVKILPRDIGESEVFSLLGEYHIIGKQDWAPFEQAGYLYRRHKHHNVAIPTLVQEIGLTKAAITQLIDTYEFMRVHKEIDPERWSYYAEYLKSSKIRKAREGKPELDELVVRQIRSAAIPRAIDIREKLAVIAEAGGKRRGQGRASATTYVMAEPPALKRRFHGTVAANELAPRSYCDRGVGNLDNSNMAGCARPASTNSPDHGEY